MTVPWGLIEKQFIRDLPKRVLHIQKDHFHVEIYGFNGGYDHASNQQDSEALEHSQCPENSLRPRKYQVIKVSFSAVMDSSRAMEGLGVNAARLLGEGDEEDARTTSDAVAFHTPFFRVAYIVPVLDKQLLHADSVGDRLDYARSTCTSPGPQ